MSYIEVTAHSFAAEVLERSRSVPVLVDFWAPWCGPCRTLGPVLERLAEEAGGTWVLAKINTDEHQELARTFEISGIPAVKAFRDGVVVDEFVGALREPQIREFLARVIPDEASRLAAEARAALLAGDATQAASLFTAALERDAAQPDALVFAAERAAEAGDGERAQALLGRLRGRDRLVREREVARITLRAGGGVVASARAGLSAAPDDPAAIHALALALAGAEQYAEALDLLLGLVRAHRRWGDDAGRRAMLQVFDVLGVHHPLTDEYRRRLSMELFK